MSAGAHAIRGEQRDTARDTSGPAPFWIAYGGLPEVPNEMDGHGMYAPPYGGGMYHVDAGVAPSVLRTGHVDHRHVQAGAAGVAFPRPAGALQLDVLQGPNPFRVDAHPQIGDLDVPSRDAMHVPVMGFPQTRQDVSGMEFAHPLPLRVHLQWEPTAHMQPHRDVNAPADLAPPNAEDDDAYTMLCEWTDERGPCNMAVFGDRVWMSHHLSRRHDVVGHEKAQRACLWRGCMDTMNKGSLARHVVSRHLRAGASCGFCSKVYSRADVARRHAKKCKAANAAEGQIKAR